MPLTGYSTLRPVAKSNITAEASETEFTSPSRKREEHPKQPVLPNSIVLFSLFKLVPNRKSGAEINTCLHYIVFRALT